MFEMPQTHLGKALAVRSLKLISDQTQDDLLQKTFLQASSDTGESSSINRYLGSTSYSLIL
jgi:hypothetical protein